MQYRSLARSAYSGGRMVFGFIKGKQNTAKSTVAVVATNAQRKAATSAGAISRSGAYEAFRPKQPITDPGFLVGRENDLDDAVEQLITPGGQVIIFGDRGIGKSSLGIIISQTLRMVPEFENYVDIRHHCTKHSTLASIFSEPLLFAGYDVGVKHLRETDVDETGINTGIAVSGGGIGISAGREQSAKRGIQTTRMAPAEQVKNPSWIANVLAEHELILFIDELENIADPEVKAELGVFLRVVSDNPSSKAKIILAGIGQTAAEVTGGHSSSARNMTEIQLEKLAPHFIEQIIDKGASLVTVPLQDGSERTLTFTPEIKTEIVKRSMGYPYFTNLICLEAAKSAVKRGDAEVDEGFELDLAVSAAMKNVSGDLKASLDVALQDGETSIGSRLLRIMVERTNSIISQDEWLQGYAEKHGETISHQKLKGAISRFTKSDEEAREMLETEMKPILIRVRPGVFKFHDPRMPSFIRLRLSGAANEGSIKNKR